MVFERQLHLIFLATKNSQTISVIVFKHKDTKAQSVLVKIKVIMIKQKNRY